MFKTTIIVITEYEPCPEVTSPLDLLSRIENKEGGYILKYESENIEINKKENKNEK